MQHLEEGTIHAWLDGELSAADQAQAERHVADCADCAAAVAEARGMIAGASRIVSALDVVRGAGGGGVVPRQAAKPAGPRSVWHSLRLTPTRAALAASLLVAAGALLTVRHDTADKMTAVFTAPVSEVSVPSSAGPFPAAGTRAIPKPTPTLARDSIAASAPVTPAVTKKSAAEPRARTAQPPVLAQVRHADSIRSPARSPAVPAASGVAAAPASVVVASEKVAAPPPSAPASNVRTPTAGATGATGAAGAAGAAVADRQPEPMRRVMDSLEQKAKIDSLRAVDSRRTFQASASRLENVVTTGAIAAAHLDITGCYRIKSDSSALSSLLPDRFALLHTTSTAAPNIVRAVTPDGRMDSVVTGSNWVQIGTDKVRIQSTVGTKHQVVLQLTSLGGVSGLASTPDGTRPIDVFRTTCRP